jgi:hypothetical protein
VVDTYGTSWRLACALGLAFLALFGLVIAVACAGMEAARDLPPQAAIEAPGALLSSLSGDGVAGERIAEVTLLQGEAPGLYPELMVVRSEPPLSDDGTSYRLTLPYSGALVDRWDVESRDLGVFRMEGETWRWSPATVNAGTRTVTVEVRAGIAWAVGPSWMMKPWQERRIVGADPRADGRNALVLHGWNGEPWDACMLALMEGIAPGYDSVAAAAYPSALDIATNGAWLRDEIEARYAGTSLDIIAFSEGGLVARAAIEPQARNREAEIDAEIGRLITIAAPHEGLPADAPPSLADDIAGQQMRVGSDFVLELNSGAQAVGVRYELIAGDRSTGGDGVTRVESALALNTLSAARRTIVPLAHSPAAGVRGMPCDAAVYEVIIDGD